MIGRRLSGRYEVISKIGEGGMAIVYKARDLILDRIVAVKVLRSEFSHDNDFIRRFRREAESVASLSHPNIVSIYDIGEEEQCYFIVMEYVEGVTLKTFIKDFQPVPLETIVYIMEQVGLAIEHAHDYGIVHRDIKPHNILVDTNDQVKVTDFGIALAVTSATMTYTNAILGSAHYLSPEQAKGGKATEKSDIYALGIVLYECLTGRLPFAGSSPVSVALMHLNDTVPRVFEFRSEVPQSMENIVVRAMAKNPDHRYNSVKEFLIDLTTSLAPNRMNTPILTFEEDSEDEIEKTKVLPVIGSVKDVVPAAEPVKETKKLIPEGEPVKKKRKAWPWVLSFILLFIILGAAAYFLIPMWSASNDVTLPNVVGKSYDTARQTLVSDHVKVNRNNTTNDTVAKDHVISENPISGNKVKKNSTVSLLVSSGPGKTDVSDYVGYDKDTAKKLVQNAGYKNVVMQGIASTSVPAGEITKQNPATGDKVITKDTVMELTYSTGPPTESVPDLTGLTKNDAATTLKNQGLNAQFSDGDYSDTIPKGNVSDQDPKSGSAVQQGSVVNVYLSKGQKKKPVTTTENINVNVTPSSDPSQPTQPVHVEIFYNDANHNNEKAVDDRTTESKSYPLSLTIDPGGQASYTVVVNGKTTEQKTINYSDIQS